MLAPFVSYVRVLELTSEPLETLPYLRLPDGQVELTICAARPVHGLRVVGTRMHALRKPTDPAREFITVRFKPGGAFPFLGLPLAHLTDTLTDLEAHWGDAAHVLGETLRTAASCEARVRSVEQALVGRLQVSPVEPVAGPRVRRALRLLDTSPIPPSVEALAERLGASTRQLRRSFLDVVGIGPKQYLRVLRLQRALSAARRSPHASFASIARLAGYADQSHLNAEFQALTGSTPSALRPRLRRCRVAEPGNMGY